jgi:ABC-2 type transport system permease protein
MIRLNPTLVGFLVKEIKQTLRDPRMRLMLFLAPIIQLTLFGVALSNEVRNIRLAEVMAPGDEMAQVIYRRSLASGWFIEPSAQGGAAHQAEGEIEPFDWLASGRADAVLVMPPGGLTHEAQRGEGRLQVLIDARNVLRAQAIENYLKAIVREVASERLGTGELPKPAIRFDLRPLYNPTFETSVFMVPGVMSMLVCLITILLTSMSLAREREMGTFETLIAAPVHAWEVVLGKTLPFVLIGMVQVPLILAAGVVLFGLPVRGPVLLLIVASFFFVTTTVSIGIMISTLAKNQQQAMLGGFLFLFPAVLLSGLMFPLENMPQVLYALAQLNPLTHFIALLRNILLKGGDLRFFFIHSGVLAALAVLCAMAALRRFRTRL